MKLLLFFLGIIFSLFGFCEALHILKLYVIFPKRKMNSTLVIILNEETATNQIIFAGEQFKWLGTKFADRVLAVSEDLDEETVKECKILAEKYGLRFVVKGKG